MQRKKIWKTYSESGISTRSENFRLVFKLENRSKDILGKANQSACDKLRSGNNPKIIVAHNTVSIMVWLQLWLGHASVVAQRKEQ